LFELGPPLQVQPAEMQRPLLLSQLALDGQAAHVAPAAPHWPLDWLA
jgi:hypothetical protein